MSLIIITRHASALHSPTIITLKQEENQRSRFFWELIGIVVLIGPRRLKFSLKAGETQCTERGEHGWTLKQ
jgi:hypothetical protein